MADENQWVGLVLTGLASCVGGGGIATILTTWLNNRKEVIKDSGHYLSDRITELEKRDRECNQRVTELEIRNRDLDREAGKLRDRVLLIEDRLITAVISADSNMKIISWNEGATLMFGYLKADMIGQDVDVLVPGYLKQKHHTAYEKAINDIDAVTNTATRPAVGVHKDGHEFNITLLITSFRNSNGAKFFEARINRAIRSGESDADIHRVGEFG